VDGVQGAQAKHTRNWDDSTEVGWADDGQQQKQQSIDEAGEAVGQRECLNGSGLGWVGLTVTD